MEETIKLLVEAMLKEYNSNKDALTFCKNANDHLTTQNESLRSTEQKSAEKFSRLRKLLAPAVTWEKGEPIYLSSFDKHVIAEICEILKINNFELKWTLE